MKSKLGRPRIGTKRRQVLTVSVDPSTIVYINKAMRAMPSYDRKAGRALDQMVQFCETHNFPR